MNRLRRLWVCLRLRLKGWRWHDGRWWKVVRLESVDIDHIAQAVNCVNGGDWAGVATGWAKVDLINWERYHTLEGHSHFEVHWAVSVGPHPDYYRACNFNEVLP